MLPRSLPKAVEDKLGRTSCCLQMEQGRVLSGSHAVIIPIKRLLRTKGAVRKHAEVFACTDCLGTWTQSPLNLTPGARTYSLSLELSFPAGPAAPASRVSPQVPEASITGYKIWSLEPPALIAGSDYSQFQGQQLG
jgi:hypothetical protein